MGSIFFLLVAGLLLKGAYYFLKKWALRGFGDLGRMTIYFQGAEEHWQLFSGIWGASS